MIAAHRVQRDPHCLLLLFLGHDLATLVVAAIRANAVRKHRLLAAMAVLDLRRFEVEVAPAYALPGV